MKSYRIFLIAMGLLFSGVLTAQETPLEVIAKMRATYDGVDAYSMHVSVQFFDANASTLMASEGDVKVDGANYYSKLFGKTTIVNDEHALIVDEKQKLLIVATNRSTRKKKGANEIIDSNLYEGCKMKFLQQNAVLDKIEIVISDPESGYSSIQLHVNPLNYTLVAVEYYYKPSATMIYQKAVIKYSDVVLDAKIPEDTFSTASYFDQRKGELITTPAYHSYQLVDQRDKNIPVIK